MRSLRQLLFQIYSVDDLHGRGRHMSHRLLIKMPLKNAYISVELGQRGYHGHTRRGLRLRIRLSTLELHNYYFNQ